MAAGEGRQDDPADAPRGLGRRRPGEVGERPDKCQHVGVRVRAEVRVGRRDPGVLAQPRPGRGTAVALDDLPQRLEDDALHPTSVAHLRHTVATGHPWRSAAGPPPVAARPCRGWPEPPRRLRPHQRRPSTSARHVGWRSTRRDSLGRPYGLSPATSGQAPPRRPRRGRARDARPPRRRAAGHHLRAGAVPRARARSPGSARWGATRSRRPTGARAWPPATPRRSSTGRTPPACCRSRSGRGSRSAAATSAAAGSAGTTSPRQRSTRCAHGCTPRAR